MAEGTGIGRVVADGCDEGVVCAGAGGGAVIVGTGEGAG
jgi:hypothetical protein